MSFQNAINPEFFYSCGQDNDCSACSVTDAWPSSSLLHLLLPDVVNQSWFSCTDSEKAVQREASGGITPFYLSSRWRDVLKSQMHYAFEELAFECGGASMRARNVKRVAQR